MKALLIAGASLLFGLHLSAQAHELVPLQLVNPRIQQEMRYASANNFTKKVVYSFNACWLQPQAAERLARVQQELESQQLGLKVWDCFRPIAAQQRFWDLVPDPRYVSPPGKGGLHTRGTAIDLTLVDAQGNEMTMPTAFDDFSPKAHREAPDTPAMAKLNSQILQRAMEKHGFVGLDSEWWHFDLKNWKDYPPLLTLDPKELQVPGAGQPGASQ